MVIGNPALVNALSIKRRGRDLNGARYLLLGRLGLTVGALGRRGGGEEGLNPSLVNKVEDTGEGTCEEEVQEDAVAFR